MPSVLEGFKCRIEHKTWIKPTRLENGHYGESTYEYGTFLDFSIDHEEYESGPGMYPVAIILRDDGKLMSTHINNVEILIPEVSEDDTETVGDTQDSSDADDI